MKEVDLCPFGVAKVRTKFQKTNIRASFPQKKWLIVGDLGGEWPARQMVALSCSATPQAIIIPIFFE